MLSLTSAEKSKKVLCPHFFLHFNLFVLFDLNLINYGGNAPQK